MRIEARRGVVLGLALGLMAGLQGCAIFTATRVANENPLIVQDAAQPHAKVYFIRPRTERNMGEADNALKIAIDRQPLLTLVKGEYTLINLKPGKFTITVDALTAMYLEPTTLHKISRSKQFTFSANRTYYIVMQMVNGEFRGIFDVPKQVEAMQARRIVKYLRPVGKARRDPINPA